ncbi:TonB-dependent receptor [Spirosoma sp.]|uniref:SusC/RagA family TonB-linked outer membrane protein n=1 Tax=Spirosoma sp. TaxID=1899569 RepID=UPI002611C7AE|nr:TonB-dependent receptor [Spirosoma sp.]MCX6216752.1 TonB-dependent receptor [Spirosoma sp.]
MRNIYLFRRAALVWLFILHMVVSISVSASSADQPVSGKITDEKGDALPGVSVVIKGTSRGTTTDATGQFKISVPSGKAVLIVSFVGYVRQEVDVNNRSVINVQLQNDDKALEEVVVVGYGTQKKVNLTGAVSTVDSKALQYRPTTNLANALQGVTPGLTITRQSGQPGNESIRLQIRGVTSANGNVDPLVILDGVSVPISTMTTLNPNDIESISVLKDAAAAAIYGAQAAGGVVLVTTKKGKSGKVTFDYLAQYGTDWSINVPGRMSLLEEAQFSNLARANSGSAPEYTEDDLQRIRNNIPYVVNPADTGTYLYYNQQSLTDQLLRKYTAMKTHNFTARGGSDKVNFLLSAGYYEKQGVFKIGPDNMKRYNVRLNLGAQLTKHLSLDTRLSYSLEQVRQSSTDANGSGLLYQVYRLRTRTPFFTPEGRYNGAGSAATAYGLLESGGYNNQNKRQFDGVVTLQAANFVKGLTLRSVAGVQYRPSLRQQFARTVPLWGKSRILSYANNPNSYQVTNELVRNTNLQFLATYEYKLGEKHNFSILGGYQWEDYREEGVATASSNLVSNDLPTLNLGDDRTKSNSEYVRARAFQSVFGRFNYNFDGKYLFEATLRQDESSKLASGLRTKIFPSASAGWNLQREDWFAKALPLFTEFKLRASWGRLGGALGDNIGNYDYLSQLSRGSALVLGDARTSYIFQGSIPSAALSWETIETSDVGIDLGFFQNRLQLTADYYVKFNRNMLTPLQLPGTIGIGTPRQNNGELKSWGWETEVKYRDRIGKDFTYSVAVNLSDNFNKLVSYAGRTVVGAGTNNLIEGYPINTIWGYQTAGYFQSADEVKNWAFQDNRTGAGDIKYVDLNGDSRINVGKGSIADHGDLVLIGTTQPRLQFGLTLSAQWKGFDLTVFMQGVGKRSYRPNTESIAPLLVTWKQALAIHNDYWTPENPNALYPRPYVGATHNYLSSDKWVLNASYMRMKNLQFGYTLPSTLTQKVRISQARFFFSGQDLFTVSGLKAFQGYYDPEMRDGVENDYPFFATASVGLNVSF